MNNNNTANFNNLNQIKYEHFGTSFPKIQIIPTIDVSNGRAVLVHKGNVCTDNGDPFERAKELSINSDFQIVDIDAAKGTGNNGEIIKKIANQYACYVAGGIRNKDKANYFLSQNAKRVVIGTSVLNSTLIEELPPNRTIVALDIDDDYNLMLRGRTELTNQNIFDIILNKKQYLSTITVTFHSTEGTGKGIDMSRVKKIKSFIDEHKIETRMIVAGGIKSIQEIKDLLEMGVSPQFGYALWNKLFTLGDIYSNIMDYSKLSTFQNTDNTPILVPCIIIRSDCTPLSLGYTDKDGIKETIDSKELVLYSRSKNKKWKKGTESGNVQHILRISFNCDRTSLLYVVSGGNFCATDKVSCFNYRNPSYGGMEFLEERIKSSVLNANNESVQKGILENKKWLICKILEEVNDLNGVSHSMTSLANDSTVLSAICDLVYYLTLYCVASDIPVRDIYKELERRHFIVSKPKYEINSPPSELKLGLCVTKEQEAKTFEYFKRNGLFIEQDLTNGKRSMKYNAHFIKDSNIKICSFIIKPKDVFRFLDYNYMDAVICFQDIMNNHLNIAKQIPLPNVKVKSEFDFLYSKILVITNEHYTLNENEEVVIYTEYIDLTRKWVEKKGLQKAKVVLISGETLGFLVNGLCDLCVCSVNNVSELKKNGLVSIDEVYISELGLFCKKKYEDVFNNNLYSNDNI